MGVLLHSLMCIGCLIYDLTEESLKSIETRIEERIATQKVIFILRVKNNFGNAFFRRHRKYIVVLCRF